MPAILTILPMLQSAIGIIGAFSGNAQAAKASAKVQDAVAIVGALTPLVTQWGDGQEVTEEDVRQALAGKDAALAELDRVIASKSAPGT